MEDMASKLFVRTEFIVLVDLDFVSRQVVVNTEAYPKARRDWRKWARRGDLDSYTCEECALPAIGFTRSLTEKHFGNRRWKSKPGDPLGKVWEATSRTRQRRSRRLALQKPQGRPKALLIP